MFSFECIINKLDIYERDYSKLTKCLIRKKEIKLSGHPEELVRQCLLYYLLENLKDYLEQIEIKVEENNLDIAIFKKFNNDNFQPNHPPIFIIEVKKKEENLLNHKPQLLNYLKSFRCEAGLLFNSEEALIMKNNEMFYEYQVENLNEILKEIISYIKNKNLDLVEYKKAENGDLESFLYLIKKYGKYSVHKISFSIKECNIITGCLFRIREKSIYYDFYGNYSTKNKQQYFSFEDFEKLISIKY